jgi:hypothetical protein
VLQNGIQELRRRLGELVGVLRRPGEPVEERRGRYVGDGERVTAEELAPAPLRLDSIQRRYHRRPAALGGLLVEVGEAVLPEQRQAHWAASNHQ